MEAAREEVLLELKGSHNDRDTELCKSYFKGLDEVTETFKQELGRHCIGTIDNCLKEK